MLGGVHIAAGRTTKRVQPPERGERQAGREGLNRQNAKDAKTDRSWGRTPGDERRAAGGPRCPEWRDRRCGPTIGEDRSSRVATAPAPPFRTQAKDARGTEPSHSPVEPAPVWTSHLLVDTRAPAPVRHLWLGPDWRAGRLGIGKISRLKMATEAAGPPIGTTGPQIRWRLDPKPAAFISGPFWRLWRFGGSAPSIQVRDDDAPQAHRQHRNVKVDQQGQGLLKSLQIGDDLRLVDRQELGDGLELHDQSIRHHQVQPRLANAAVFVANLDGHLTGESQPAMVELDTKSLLVDRFREARPEYPMDLDRRTNDVASEGIEFLAGFCEMSTHDWSSAESIAEFPLSRAGEGGAVAKSIGRKMGPRSIGRGRALLSRTRRRQWNGEANA
jgi:hypothetical protein